MSGRTYLKENAGMLFLSAELRDIQMWMLNTFIPLDMLFFDDTLRIVHIHENAIPEDLSVISSGKEVRGVIELNGGVSAKKIFKSEIVFTSSNVYWFRSSHFCVMRSKEGEIPFIKINC